MQEEDERILVTQGYWAKVIKRPNGCWEWMGAKTNTHWSGDIGEGPLYRLMGISRCAKRAALYLLGYDTDIMRIIRSDCGTPTCVNPDHLVAWVSDFQEWTDVKGLPMRDDGR